MDAVLDIRPVEGKGRGLFALRAFERGTTIERAPVLVLPAAAHVHLDQTALYDYYFAWGQPEQIALVLGYTSFANHSYQPNARYEKDVAAGLVMLVALQDIEAGDEVTVNYNGDPDDEAPLWFPVQD